MGSFYQFSRALLAISSRAAGGDAVTFLPMSDASAPRPAPREALSKRVMAVLAPGPRPGDALWQALAGRFGPIDFKGAFVPFEATSYYREEFGSGLSRGFISFRGLFDPEGLPAFKREAAALEAELAQGGRRTCNLDAGYLDADKLVLASFKRGPCKLYLGGGIYADMLLRYAKGRFEPQPWAFPDFQDGRYHGSLLVIREKLKSELRGRAGPEAREGSAA